MRCVYESFVPGAYPAADIFILDVYMKLYILNERNEDRKNLNGLHFAHFRLNGYLTEVRRTRPERTMSGVVRGMAESSVPVDRLSWRGNPAGMNCCGDRLHSLECAAVLSS